MFQTQYHKEYSLLDRLNHYVQFVRTTAEIRQHNQLYEAGVETFKMDVNEYADVVRRCCKPLWSRTRAWKRER